MSMRGRVLWCCNSIFVPIQIQVDESKWEGVRRKYWMRDVYYLPICLKQGP